MEFFDQYKHPQWQKKRLEVLSAAEYACQQCGDGETQLHVHHKQYFKGRKVWEYSTSELMVLCKDCHEAFHTSKDALNELLVRLHPDALEEVVCLVAGYCSTAHGPAHISDEQFLTEVFSKDPYSVLAGGLIGAIVNRTPSPAAINSIRKSVESADMYSPTVIELPAIMKPKFEDGAAF